MICNYVRCILMICKMLYFNDLKSICNECHNLKPNFYQNLFFFFLLKMFMKKLIIFIIVFLTTRIITILTHVIILCLDKRTLVVIACIL